MRTCWRASWTKPSITGFVSSAILALSLAGCDQRSSAPQDAWKKPEIIEGFKMSSQDMRSSGAAGEAAPAMDAAIPSKPEQPGQNTPAGPVMLAYSYGMAIEAPLKNVPALAKQHEQVCAAAGPNVCQVLGATNFSSGEDSVSAHLSLRAAPAWLSTFRTQIETDAKKSSGRVRSNSVTSEDLTRSIVDTTAQLTAQKTLRGRLQELLASRPGKLSDLLEVERELARVQGLIDSQESELAMMRQRVHMSTLEIDYQSETQAVASGVFEPLVSAFKGIIGNIVIGFAAMITIASAILPWLVVLIPAFIYGRRFWRQRRTAKAAPKPQAE